MQIAPDQFETAAGIEQETALAAVTYKMAQDMRESGKTDLEYIFLQGQLKIGRVIMRADVQLVASLSLERLTDALESYAVSEMPTLSVLERLRLIASSVQRARREADISQRGVAQLMLQDISHAQGVDQFLAWLEPLQPEDFIDH